MLNLYTKFLLLPQYWELEAAMDGLGVIACELHTIGNGVRWW